MHSHLASDLPPHASHVANSFVSILRKCLQINVSYGKLPFVFYMTQSEAGAVELVTREIVLPAYELIPATYLSNRNCQELKINVTPSKQRRATGSNRNHQRANPNIRGPHDSGFTSYDSRPGLARITGHKSQVTGGIAFQPPTTYHATLTHFLIENLPIRNRSKFIAFSENLNSNRQKKGIF